MNTQYIDTQPQTILFAHYGDNWIRGSERCLLDLISHLDKKKFKALLWCNQPIMQKSAAALGIEVICSDFPILFGWQAPRFNVLAFFKLIHQASMLIKQHQVQLVHANSAAPCQWLSFAAKKCAVPLVCHLHSIYQLRDRLTLGLYQTDMVVGVSQYVVTPLLHDNKPKEQVEVIANGIDTQKLLAQPEVNLRGTGNVQLGDFVIATLGSLIKRKGIDRLIDCIALLVEKQLPVHLLVIGDGEQFGALSKQIKQLQLQQHITLLGECDNAHAILRGTADLFISGAREEAFGLVFAEASLAGLAIIAPDIGGISEVVQHQQNGILINTSDERGFIKSLANEIEQLYYSPIRCDAIGKTGKALMLKNFTIEQNCLQFSQLYQRLIEAKKVQQPWNKKLLSSYASLTAMSSALLHAYQRASKLAQVKQPLKNKGGLLHER